MPPHGGGCPSLLEAKVNIVVYFLCQRARLIAQLIALIGVS